MKIPRNIREKTLLVRTRVCDPLIMGEEIIDLTEDEGGPQYQWYCERQKKVLVGSGGLEGEGLFACSGNYCLWYFVIEYKPR